MFFDKILINLAILMSVMCFEVWGFIVKRNTSKEYFIDHKIIILQEYTAKL